MLIRMRTLAVFFAAAALLWAAGFVGFTIDIKSGSVEDHKNTEAIIVLTGGPDRINAGLDLLAAGRARYLFISGVNEHVTTSQLLKMWRADAQDYSCCIVLGHKAQNTYQNALEAHAWLKENDIKTIRLLTTDYHMPRAWLEFKAEMPEITVYTHPIKAAHTNWLLIFGEYNKTLFTLARALLGYAKP